MPMEIIDKLDSILFLLFVISIIWFTWVPLSYTFKNLKNLDFDFYRDIAFYSDTLRGRWQKPIGKCAIFYSGAYLIVCLIRFIISR